MGLSHLLRLFLGLWFIITAADSDYSLTKPVCNATDAEGVHYEFNTDVVTSEHIVTFKGYFPKSTREKYVTAALKNAGVSTINRNL